MTRRTLLSLGVALATLGAILWPLDLSPAHAGDVGSRIQLLPGDVGWVLDAVRNVVVFVPLGVALGRSRVVTVVAVCALLSTTAEFLQVLQPYRFVSVTDVAFNTLGGLAGRGVVAFVPGILTALARSRQGLRLGATAAGVAVTTCAIWGVDRGFHPSGWRSDYILARNSSALGQVPWCGTVERLQVRAGEAVWAGEELPWQPRVMEMGPCRGATWWAAVPPSALARAVQSHGGLAIDLAATPSRDQLGPARILTWADTRDGRKRNVLVAQESDSLVVYVRRRLGGAEGRRPYYVIPGVFEAGVTAAVAMDIDEERTIIRTDAETLIHRYDLSRDWPYLVQGRSRYAPGGPGRALVFWSAAWLPSTAVAGAATATAAPITAVLWVGGTALALLVGGLTVTGGATAPALAAWVVATTAGLAVGAFLRGTPPRTRGNRSSADGGPT